MASFPLLDISSEDALHKSRLFNTDEKAFRRVAHRILGPQSLLTTNGKAPPNPKKRKRADAEENSTRNVKKEFESLREDVLLEFSNFESSLVRMQFLLNSNAQERERYASEKVRIQATAQDVKSNTGELRERLEDSQKQLALRKEYDELAEKITSNRLLKPREDQLANIEKLNNEIAELERESKEYATTWAERREQFGKIIEEGMQLRRLIRDEKEEVERREGMEGRDEHEEGDGVSTRGRSNVNTPLPEAGGATPLHAGSDDNTLGPNKYSTRGKSPFRASTPIPEEGTPKPEATDVEDEADEGEVSGGEVSSPSEGLVAEDEDEDRVRSTPRDHDRGAVDTMDTT